MRWRNATAALLLALSSACEPERGSSERGRPGAGPAMTPTVEPSPTSHVGARVCSPPVLEADGPTVNVFLIPRDLPRPADAGRYVAATRPLSEREAAAPIRAALTELFSGVTSAERRGGCTSIFTKSDRDLLLGLSLEGGRLVVNLKNLTREGLGNASTSHAGSVFFMQVLLTAGQFPEVEKVAFEMEGSCRGFYEFMQIGVCMDLDVRRSAAS